MLVFQCLKLVNSLGMDLLLILYDYCAVFCQMVCTQQAEEDETVLGLHLTGPNAGEVLQGFAVAME